MQQIFRLLIFLIQPYMFRATNSPILRSTFWLYTQLLVRSTETAADRCHGFHLHCGTSWQQCRCLVPKAVYAVKKGSWGWANLSPETCRAELKRLIYEKVVASCWLFTSLYQICTGIQSEHNYTILSRVYNVSTTCFGHYLAIIRSYLTYRVTALYNQCIQWGTRSCPHWIHWLYSAVTL